MNRGVFQSTSVQQTVGGRPGWWSLNSMRSSPQQISPILPSSSSSFASSAFPHPYAPPSSGLSSTLCHDIEERAESWSQLLLGEYVGEEESCNFNSFQPKVENWYHRAPNMVGVKHESSEANACVQYPHGNHEEIQHADAARYSWSQHMLPVSSSPRSSCITSFGSNMLDFSNIKSEGKHPNPDHSSECNGPGTGGSAFKKARIQTCSPHSTFKVRKEKLGDRITVLHQLVSPFGKTDTASVLLEAIGYIRFLQGQIEALSSPYMRNASATSTRFGQGERSCIFPEEPGQLLNDACMKRRETCEQKDAGQNEPKKDLRSRGLCLVPLSCTMHVGSDNGADYWAPAFSGGGFQ